MYHLTYSESALRDLKKMDRHEAALILSWIEKNLVNCENPRIHGKQLSANRSEQWWYRIGDYRIIALIDDYSIKILVLRIGHRKDIYSL